MTATSQAALTMPSTSKGRHSAGRSSARRDLIPAVPIQDKHSQSSPRSVSQNGIAFRGSKSRARNGSCTVSRRGTRVPEMACKILLTTTVGWPSVARMAGGFAAASCVVDVLSPSGTPVTLSRYIRALHAYRPLSPISSLAAAIDASQPDLLVACDDRSVQHLLLLYSKLRIREGLGHPVAALIERSFGKPENFAGMTSRGAAPPHSSFSPASYSVSLPNRSRQISAVHGSISEPQRLSR